MMWKSSFQPPDAKGNVSTSFQALKMSSLMLQVRKINKFYDCLMAKKKFL